MVRLKTELEFLVEDQDKKFCPFLKTDKDGRPYCSKNLNKSSKPEVWSYNPCRSKYSLKNWCLNPEKYKTCAFYTEELMFKGGLE